MAKLYNLAAMTVASTGTGTITLGSAATINGVLYLSFAAAGVSNAETVAYSINDVGGSEVGTGTYTSAGTTLTRTPITSTNSNNAINMTSAAIVRISPAKADIANLRESNGFTAQNVFSTSTGNIFAITANGSNVVDSTQLGLQLVGNDAGVGGSGVFYSFGNQSVITYGRANGTFASKTALSSGDSIGAFNWVGYDGSIFTISGKVRIAGIAAENWSSTNQGTYLQFQTTVTGTTTRQEVTRMQNSGGVTIGPTSVATDPGKDNLLVSGAIASKVASTFTGTSGTVADADSAAIFNPSGTFTATLPTASSFPGRWLYVKTIAAQTVNSASSNIVPVAGGAAGTALLTATAGKWAILQSNGTNWEIFASN